MEQINCRDILLEDVDKVRAIVEYVSTSAIENLVVGAASRNGFMRYIYILLLSIFLVFIICNKVWIDLFVTDYLIFVLSRRFKTDLPTTLSKSSPDFCNVYVISKGKIASVRNASRPAPYHRSMQDSEFDNNQNPTTPEKVKHDHSNSTG